MQKINFLLLLLLYWNIQAQAQQGSNPIIYADVPDLSMIRVGENYYMSSTTMHMNPGLPIMKSKDLVNWEIISYAYDTLGNADDMKLVNGKSMYGKGSWASSLRYHKGKYYASTFAGNTGKTYIYVTEDLEKGPWKSFSFAPSLHDHTLFFEDDQVYLIWGAGKIRIVALEEDFSGIKKETEQVLIENAHSPIPKEIILPAEGSQLFKIAGKYYLMHIAWPKGGMRTVVLHKSDHLFGPYEGKVVLEDKGVAQGGLIDTPTGDWFAYLFRDFGAVGRIPYLVPVRWEEDWPIFGKEGKVPMELDLPGQKNTVPAIVGSDDFKRRSDEPDLPLVWQWNHNPVHELWNIDRGEGILSFLTDRLDSSWLSARNTLTQRTFGPTSSATIKLSFQEMKEGDVAGLGLLQHDYGWIGVKMENGQKILSMALIDNGQLKTIAGKPLKTDHVWLKASCDFQDRKDEAKFYFSEDKGATWEQLGPSLKMKYSLRHFMGYRFALFYYATHQTGGRVGFEDFNINPSL